MKKKLKAILMLIPLHICFLPLTVESKPITEEDFLWYGVGIGVGVTLCDLSLNGLLDNSTGNQFIKNYFTLNLTSNNKRLLQQSKDGFNGGAQETKIGSRVCKLRVY